MPRVASDLSEASSSRDVAKVPPRTDISAELRRRILEWHYPPGHHLGEQALCAEFAASRIPIREALRALAEQGLVDKVPNQGCFVKQPDVEDTHELYELRLALELYVGETLVHKTLPPDWVASQRACWERLLAVRADEAMDGDALVQADSDFHLGLAQATGNRRITEALREINDRLRFVRLAVITTPHRVQETAGEHLAVLDALERHDAEAVRRTLRQNINHARNKVDLALGRALMKAHARR
ncbi:GntR family transcriptional regulator [Opitutales bacterium ASA1]|uniref:GntR family transcriptional regulator n=1 Tax=Congregicoccus parvus TaxID=3081749 RepID=UPI002B2CE43F|nr:GntR family transcriptional regulator [Opitutales bacterium ASA1]